MKMKRMKNGDNICLLPASYLLEEGHNNTVLFSSVNPGSEQFTCNRKIFGLGASVALDPSSVTQERGHRNHLGFKSPRRLLQI